MQVSADKVWGAAQAQLKGMLSADIFNLWFAPLRATGVENNIIILEVATGIKLKVDKSVVLKDMSDAPVQK